MRSCANLTGRAAGPTRLHTRPAMPVCSSWIWRVAPAAGSPARSPRAAISSGRMFAGDRRQLVVGLGEALDPRFDLGRGHAGVGQPQARLGAVEDEVRALD